MEENKEFLRQDNNYRTLKAFQKARREIFTLQPINPIRPIKPINNK